MNKQKDDESCSNDLCSRPLDDTKSIIMTNMDIGNVEGINIESNNTSHLEIDTSYIHSTQVNFGGHWSKLSLVQTNQKFKSAKTNNNEKDEMEQFEKIFSSDLLLDKSKLFCIQYAMKFGEEEKISYHFAHEYGYLLQLKNHNKLIPMSYRTDEQPYIQFEKMTTTGKTNYWQPTSVHSSNRVVRIVRNKETNSESQIKNCSVIGTDKSNLVFVQWDDRTKKMLFCSAPYVYIRYHNQIYIMHTEKIKSVTDFGGDVLLSDCLPLIETILFNQQFTTENVCVELFSYLFHQIPYALFAQKESWKNMISQYIRSQSIFKNFASGQGETWSCENKHLQ